MGYPRKPEIFTEEELKKKKNYSAI